MHQRMMNRLHGCYALAWAASPKVQFVSSMQLEVPLRRVAISVFVSTVTLILSLFSELELLQVISTNWSLSLRLMLNFSWPNWWLTLPDAVPLTDADLKVMNELLAPALAV